MWQRVGRHLVNPELVSEGSDESVLRADTGWQVDHMRAVGPGVYVGVGWKSPRENKVEMGRRFLPFILVREYDS